MTQGPSQLPMLAFERETLSGADCFARWRDILSSVFDVDLPSRDAIADFDGSMTAYHLGSLLVSSTAGGQVNFRRSSAMIARTSVEHFLVQLYLDGGFAGSVDDRDIVMGAGDVCVLDLSRPLQTRASAFRNITVVVPRDSLAPLVKAPDALHGLVLPGGSPVGSLLADHLRALYMQLPAMTAREAQAAAVGTTGLVAACVGPAFDARERAVTQVQAEILERIRRFIDERLEDADLDGDTICRTFGLSRSSLYRLFEPQGGLVAHIRRRRLSRAFADLVSRTEGRTRVIDVALRWGFGSEASFSRAFRAAYGLSPRDAGETADGIRRLLAPDVGGSETGATERRLQRWMRSLDAA
ncbi:MAG: helix-turn-helix domain-containing protein [Pseudomonadota bacterium]